MLGTRWMYVYDLVVVFLSVVGAVVAVMLIRPPRLRLARWTLRTLAWIAFVILSLRGVAGLVADGTSDPIWWPLFLVGGLLFGGVVWASRDNATEPWIGIDA